MAAAVGPPQQAARGLAGRGAPARYRQRVGSALASSPQTPLVAPAEPLVPLPQGSTALPAGTTLPPRRTWCPPVASAGPKVRSVLTTRSGLGTGAMGPDPVVALVTVDVSGSSRHRVAAPMNREPPVR